LTLPERQTYGPRAEQVEHGALFVAASHSAVVVVGTPWQVSVAAWARWERSLAAPAQRPHEVALNARLAALATAAEAEELGAPQGAATEQQAAPSALYAAERAWARAAARAAALVQQAPAVQASMHRGAQQASAALALAPRA